VTYLVDGRVLCEPTKPNPHPGVVRWLQEHEGELAIDAVILGEVKFGILLLPRGGRRDRLERWFAEGVDKITCLPWDRAIGLRWAQLLAHLRATGREMPVKDSLIAATALLHGLTIATRNRRDFARAGVKLVDPFA
jgi:hypothetical protein